jgi:hypothetical protein
MVNIKPVMLLLAVQLLAACATSGESEERREETAIADFSEVNELVSVDALRTRTMEPLSSREVGDRFVLVSARREDDYLLEFYSRCTRRFDGRVEPDIRKDAGALYPRVDTFRGCRIKAIYALGPGQADEVRELGKSVGGN